MDFSSVYMYIGFALAAYSVVSNDSLQVLGTFIASNKHISWYKLWLFTAAVMAAVIFYGWYVNGGDISYQRLEKIPFQEIQWYHALAPAVLLLLTRYGIPVSTSLLVLSVFASSIVLEKILIKSFVGYGLAAFSGYLIWWAVSKYLNEKTPVKESNKKFWVVGSWVTTALLWSVWLMHDVANISVFLPRQLSLELLLFTLSILIIGLGHLFYIQGGKLHKVILDKSGTRFMRSATLINLIYFFILYFFKELNSIPMSTTFVFVGLITGRELAIYRDFGKKFTAVFPIVAKDFGKLMLGLAVSISLVFVIYWAGI